MRELRNEVRVTNRHEIRIVVTVNICDSCGLCLRPKLRIGRKWRLR